MYTYKNHYHKMQKCNFPNRMSHAFCNLFHKFVSHDTFYISNTIIALNLSQLLVPYI